jgi:D-cysteine desulfhydrase
MTTIESRCAQSSLLRRFPALAALPRADLGVVPSPVTQLGDHLWIKRDDLNATEYGGNKVRALEWLLGAVGKDETVLTAGGDGSTHILATAFHARRLGLPTVAVRWPHDMHPVAHAVAAQSAALCERTIRSSTVPTAFLRLAFLRSTAPYHFIPPGGATPLGTLGHIAGALELADQIAAGTLPEPSLLVVPLGTGSTAAGLSLGLGIAGLRTRVVAVRVVPRIAFPAQRLARMVTATRRFLADHTGVSAASLKSAPVTVDHSAFAGAYGRPLPSATQLPGIPLDATYSEKAATVANEAGADLGAGGGPVLFWLTFDGRSLS